MPNETAVDECSVLATFERRGHDNGDQIRITAAEQGGYHHVDLRFWFYNPRSDRPSPTGDGWFRSKAGVRLREQELDDAILSLEAVRDVVRAEGRSTGAPNRDSGPRRHSPASTPPPPRRPAAEPTRSRDETRSATRAVAPVPTGGDEEDIPF